LRDVVEGVGGHLGGVLIVVFGGLPEGRLGGVASGGVDDYAQLWGVLLVGLGAHGGLREKVICS
jgi:hypothetical protein